MKKDGKMCMADGGAVPPAKGKKLPPWLGKTKLDAKGAPKGAAKKDLKVPAK